MKINEFVKDLLECAKITSDKKELTKMFKDTIKLNLNLSAKGIREQLEAQGYKVIGINQYGGEGYVLINPNNPVDVVHIEEPQLDDEELWNYLNVDGEEVEERMIKKMFGRTLLKRVEKEEVKEAIGDYDNKHYKELLKELIDEVK